MQYGWAERTLTKQHQDAIKDAAIAEGNDINDNLQAITREKSDVVWNEDKTRLLVVTWKQLKKDYEGYIKYDMQTSYNPNQVVWVTAAHQVKTFCHRYLHENPRQLTMNLICV